MVSLCALGSSPDLAFVFVFYQLTFAARSSLPEIFVFLCNRGKAISNLLTMTHGKIERLDRGREWSGIIQERSKSCHEIHEGRFIYRWDLKCIVSGLISQTHHSYAWGCQRGNAKLDG